MLTKYLLVMVASLTLSMGCHVSEKSVQEKLIQHLNNSTIELLDDDGDTKCTGVWVKENLIITAAHCVTGNQYSITSVIYRNYRDSLVRGKTNTAKVYRVDTLNDLALIVSTSNNHDIAQMNNNFSFGEHLWIIGHTSGYIYSLSEGIVSGYREMRSPNQANVKVIQISGAVWMGNSGGGIFNSDGELLGICSFVSGKAPMISFFVPSEQIKKFME